MCAIVDINTLLALLVVHYFQLLHRKPLIILYLPSTMKLRQGNIFRSVCQEFCPQGRSVCLSACWDTPPGQNPPSRTPWADTPLCRHPLGRHQLADTPPGQTPPDRHPQADTSLGRHTPPGQTPPGQTPAPPPPNGYCRGRYASYLNAFLF